MSAFEDASLRALAQAHVEFDRLTREASVIKDERDKLARTCPGLKGPVTVVLEDGTAVLIERHADAALLRVTYAISRAVS